MVLTKSSGEMAKRLRADNIQVKVVEDLAVGVEMHNVDCVLLGAEGVVETGGELYVVIRGYGLRGSILCNDALARSPLMPFLSPFNAAHAPVEFKTSHKQVDLACPVFMKLRGVPLTTMTA